jgi:hypothetical protein
MVTHRFGGRQGDCSGATRYLHHRPADRRGRRPVEDPPAGANLAMQDGAELATALVANPGRPEDALAKYEAALFPRSEASANQSAANLQLCFNPESPQGLLDFFNSVPH